MFSATGDQKVGILLMDTNAKRTFERVCVPITGSNFIGSNSYREE